MSATEDRAGLMPALLTRTSIRPVRSMIDATMAGMEAQSPTWQATPNV
jgi:hypothetical protein